MTELDLLYPAGCSDAAPERPVDLLFIHHSVGGQWLADPGALEPVPEARRSIHRTHPNGGGLRTRLGAARYIVHEASYSSIVGERTDLFDWLPKFRSHMPRILATHHQDALLERGQNRVVMFKSCYPNSAFLPDRGQQGRPEGPELTLSNARATLSALRDEFVKHPDTLFVYITAPPLRLQDPAEPAWKALAKQALGRATRDREQRVAAAAVREFNDWTKARDGWLRDYPQRNIAVFDYFGVLTADGRSNFLQYPGDAARDNHPSSAGQRLAAERFVPFLNRAVRYAGCTSFTR